MDTHILTLSFALISALVSFRYLTTSKCPVWEAIYTNNKISRKASQHPSPHRTYFPHIYLTMTSYCWYVWGTSYESKANHPLPMQWSHTGGSSRMSRRQATVCPPGSVHMSHFIWVKGQPVLVSVQKRVVVESPSGEGKDWVNIRWCSQRGSMFSTAYSDVWG